MDVRRLRSRLGNGSALLCPGVHDPLSAAMAAEAGFEAVYLSGAAIAYTQLGGPDLGLVSMTEVADVLGRIRERVDVPVIVDADTGWGNALNVERTVRVFERAGASAIQLEDQTFPKRCGHLGDKLLVPCHEMVAKIRAAVAVRREALIIARTDAIAVEGFAAALDRARAYADAGAEVLFIEAPESREQMREIVARFGERLPLLANMVEGGRTPMSSAAELGAMGFRIVIFPGGTVRALAHMLRTYFSTLHADGSTAAYRDRMLDFTGLNDLLGTRAILARGGGYDEGAGT